MVKVDCPNLFLFPLPITHTLPLLTNLSLCARATDARSGVQPQVAAVRQTRQAAPFPLVRSVLVAPARHCPVQSAGAVVVEREGRSRAGGVRVREEPTPLHPPAGQHLYAHAPGDSIRLVHHRLDVLSAYGRAGGKGE